MKNDNMPDLEYDDSGQDEEFDGINLFSEMYPDVLENIEDIMSRTQLDFDLKFFKDFESRLIKNYYLEEWCERQGGIIIKNINREEIEGLYELIVHPNTSTILPLYLQDLSTFFKLLNDTRFKELIEFIDKFIQALNKYGYAIPPLVTGTALISKINDNE